MLSCKCYEIYQNSFFIEAILISHGFYRSLINGKFHQFIFIFLKEFFSSSLLFKVGLSPSKQYFICFNDSPSKIIKNHFCFILKGLFVLKVFKFWSSTFWSSRKNSLIVKVKLILKFMTSQPG